MEDDESENLRRIDFGPPNTFNLRGSTEFRRKKVENGVDGLTISGKDRHWNKRAESIIKEFSSKMELIGPKKCEGRPT